MLTETLSAAPVLPREPDTITATPALSQWCPVTERDFAFNKDLIKEEVRRRFSNPYIHTPSDQLDDDKAPITVKPLFSCPGIANDPTLQNVLVDLAAEFLDVLLYRDEIINQRKIALEAGGSRQQQIREPVSYFTDRTDIMNCPVFRATRNLSMLVIHATQALSIKGPFENAITEFTKAITDPHSKLLDEGMQWPSKMPLAILVGCVLTLRSDLSGRQRELAVIPRIKDESEAIITLRRMIAPCEDSSHSRDAATSEAKKIAQGIMECDRIPIVNNLE